MISFTLNYKCPLSVKLNASNENIVAYLTNLWNSKQLKINNNTNDANDTNNANDANDATIMEFELIDEKSLNTNNESTILTHQIDNKKEELKNQLEKIKDIGINPYDNSSLEDRVCIKSISDEIINIIYDYKYSDKSKIDILNKINKGTIFSKYKSGCTNNPENFRYLVDHHESIKVLDRLWCVKLLEKCEKNLPDKNIYIAPLLKDFNTSIIEIISNNTISSNNNVLIDIKKAFDSLEWDIIEDLLIANLTRKINENVAKDLVNEYMIILKNRELYYNNIRIPISKGVSTGLPSSTIVFTFVFEEIINRWLLFNDYKINIDFKIFIYVDDVFIHIINIAKASDIVNSLFEYLATYKLYVNKKKTKADIKLNINNIYHPILPTDYYLGIPFTRDIKLYGKLILAELNKKIHVDWNDVYNILSDDNTTLYKSICIGFLSYKLKPLYIYYNNNNTKGKFTNETIKKFIYENYVKEENIINNKKINTIKNILFIAGGLVLSLSILSLIGLHIMSIKN